MRGAPVFAPTVCSNRLGIHFIRCPIQPWVPRYTLSWNIIYLKSAFSTREFMAISIAEPIATEGTSALPLLGTSPSNRTLEPYCGRTIAPCQCGGARLGSLVEDVPSTSDPHDDAAPAGLVPRPERRRRAKVLGRHPMACQARVQMVGVTGRGRVSAIRRRRRWRSAGIRRHPPVPTRGFGMALGGSTAEGRNRLPASRSGWDCLYTM